MPIYPLPTTTLPRPATGVARRLLVAAGVLALAMAVPGERLSAQAPSAIPDMVWPRALTTQATALAAPGGCLSLRVVPGDTAGRTMPRAPGDTLADQRMPRGGNFRPPCEPVRAVAPTVARLFRMPDGTYRPLPTPKVSVPPRP